MEAVVTENKNSSKTYIEMVDDKPFKCEYCPKSFKMSCTLKTHIRIHTGEKPFQCEVCKKSFSQSGHLVEHKRTHTGEKPFQCSACGKSFVNNSHLRTHARIHSGQNMFSCSSCDSTFTSANGLKKHVENKHTNKTTAKQLASAERKALPKRFACSICGSAFSASHALKIHLRSHSGEKPYTCQLCNKGFTQKAHLRKHMSTHGSPKKSKLKKKWPTERLYRCVTCGERFSHLATLKNHISKHTGEMLFRCGLCGRHFSSQSLMGAHMRTHTGERPHHCQTCGKSFRQRSVLVCHQRIHSGDKRYSCEICSKRFITHSDLAKHTRIHTGERPYKCELCTSRFGRSNHLTRHMKIHFENKKTQQSSGNSKTLLTHKNSAYNEKIILNNGFCNEKLPDDSFARLDNFNNCCETSKISYQHQVVEFPNFSSFHNRILNPALENYTCDKELTLDQNNRLNSDSRVLDVHRNYNEEFSKYQTIAFENGRQNGFQNVNQRFHAENKGDFPDYAYRNGYNDCIDANVDVENPPFKREKIMLDNDKGMSKSSCKWQYQSIRSNLKSSCNETRVRIADTTHPWQCGICEIGFADQKDLSEHVMAHKGSKPSVKYTKLVKNPESGILEELQIFPKERLKIVPIELLQPIIDNYLVHRNQIKRKNIQDVGHADETNPSCAGVPTEGRSDVTFSFNNHSKSIDGSGSCDAPKINEPDGKIGNSQLTNDFEEISVLADHIGDECSSDDEKRSDRINVTAKDAITINSKKTIENIAESKKTAEVVTCNFTSKNESSIKSPKKKPAKRRSYGVKEFPCKECPKVFKFSNALLVHSRCHTGERPYSCGQCGRSFTQSGQLREHARTHSGERRFQCARCGKTFINTTHLKSHMKTHTGEKPYECSICHKRFGHRVSWQLHQYIHTGETPFKCEACEKGFRQPSSLRSHLLTHSGLRPFACSICSSSFKQRSSLSAHIRTHQNVRRHACQLCQRAFLTSSDLKRHTAAHTNVRDYACTKPYCGKTFKRNAHLKRHMATHWFISCDINES